MHCVYQVARWQRLPLHAGATGSLPLLYAAGESKFNLTGLVIMFIAETCEATRCVLTL
jgi:hypothetical protein